MQHIVKLVHLNSDCQEISHHHYLLSDIEINSLLKHIKDRKLTPYIAVTVLGVVEELDPYLKAQIKAETGTIKI